MISKYVSPKIKMIGDAYKIHKNTATVMDVLRHEYTGLTSYNTALTRLRAYLISTNDHHDLYNRAIKDIETELVDEYVESIRNSPLDHDKEITECIKFLYDFRDISLHRQLKVVLKLKKGQMTLPRSSLVKQIIQIPLLPEYIADLHLTEEEHNQLTQYEQEKQYLLSSNVVIVHNPDAIIRSCVEILRTRDSQTPLESLCTALAFLTGRRSVELLLTGHFEIIEDRKNWVLFCGQVKTGLQEILTVKDDLPKQFAIPVLTSPKLLTSSLQDLQSRVKTLLGDTVTRETVNQRLSHRLCKAVKSVVHSKMKFHDLRTLYALVSFEAFKPHTFGINGWIKDCLGHSTLKMSTHYTRMQIGPVTKIN